MNRIVQRIRALTDMSVSFENVISVTGHGFECSENLVALGVISFSESTAKIDFNRLYDIKSSTVLIRIRTKASNQLKKLLVFCKIEQIPQHADAQIESHIEVALDYANQWHKMFDQYDVRDIGFISTLNIDLETILEQIPKKQAKRIIKAAEQAVHGNTDAVEFLNIMTEFFLWFESDEIISRLRHSISVEPRNFVLKEIYPTMQRMEIPNTGYPVVLPGRVRVRLECVLDGDQVVAHGRLVIDIEKFSEVLRELVKKIQLKTLKLRF